MSSRPRRSFKDRNKGDPRLVCDVVWHRLVLDRHLFVLTGLVAVQRQVGIFSAVACHGCAMEEQHD